MRSKVKITILKSEVDEELARQYAIPNFEVCPLVNDQGISSRTLRTAKSRIGDKLRTEKDGTSWVCYLRQ